MTSKEALESCFNTISTNDKIRWEEHYKVIKKDLEILDIIKRSIYSRETHKYVLNEKLKGQKFMNISLYISGDTDVDKVKEWLEHE